MIYAFDFLGKNYSTLRNTNRRLKNKYLIAI